MSYVLPNHKLVIERGDIVLAEYFFDNTVRIKPVLIVQNDIGNKYSPLVIVVPIVAHEAGKKGDPMNVVLDDDSNSETNLKESSILLNVIMTINKNDLKEKVGRLPDRLMVEVEKGLLLSLGFKHIGR